VDEQKFLAERFEANRGHLRAVAYRMLGSASDADDAVQEAWLRLSRAGADGIDNLGGWLTTVVARVCLDTLRSRRSRHEEPLDAPGTEPAEHAGGIDPEQEAQMADSVGLALLVVLDALTPAERVAFVMHDMFDLSFDEIAPIVGRSPTAARQLASRARRRVRGAGTPDAGIARQREVAAAYLAAARTGNFDALLALLDPDVVMHTEVGGKRSEFRGAREVAGHTLVGARGAAAARLALIDGTVGVIAAPRGRLVAAVRFALAGDKIVAIDVITDPTGLKALQLAVIDDGI
jgi:RNA polymerase sigma-70 factor (ECF subfamily)